MVVMHVYVSVLQIYVNYVHLCEFTHINTSWYVCSGLI